MTAHFELQSFTKPWFDIKCKYSSCFKKAVMEDATSLPINVCSLVWEKEFFHLVVSVTILHLCLQIWVCVLLVFFPQKTKDLMVYVEFCVSSDYHV